MKAVVYGAGNIGRGFIGALLSRAGYSVTFIDLAEEIVVALRREMRYPLRIVTGDGHQDVWVEGVDAVDGRDDALAASCVAQADLVATAVGARALPHIAPVIARGLQLRFARSDAPLDILLCENLMDADRLFAAMLKEHLPPNGRLLLDARVGLVETSIGRMVPVQTPAMQDGNPLRVCVEPYGFLPVDEKAFKGEKPIVPGMVFFSPFSFYLRRKLYIHNMGHATCAYLGLYLGDKFVHEAIGDGTVRMIVQNAMLESALALSAECSASLRDLVLHIFDLLNRFGNQALGDTCARVGGDIPRKLAPTDRLVGAALACKAQGGTPAYISIGIAGALHWHMQQTGASQDPENAGAVFRALSGDEAYDLLWEGIAPLYRRFCDGAILSEISRLADRRRGASLGDIV